LRRLRVANLDRELPVGTGLAERDRARGGVDATLERPESLVVQRDVRVIGQFAVKMRSDCRNRRGDRA
jgi:hypothetical protein